MQNNRSEPMPVKYWSFAGLMLTDWCNASCASCYLKCSPMRQDRLAVETAIDIWHQLEALSPHGCRIHITGGEIFGADDWPKVIELLKAAQSQKLPAAKVETNAFWATDEKIVRDRLQQLNQAGLESISISADPFHQQFVPISRPRLLARIAAEVLGADRLQVRWEDWLREGQDLADLSPKLRNKQFAEWIATGRDRINGRAAEILADYLPGQSPETFAGQNCRQVLLRGKHVHISPQSHILPGVCAGISLGQADSQPIADTWEELYSFAAKFCANSNQSDEFDEKKLAACRLSPKPILSILSVCGPYGLMQLARSEGFAPANRYASKCHLCWSVRRYLRTSRGLYVDELQPSGLYLDEESPSCEPNKLNKTD